MPDAIIKIVFGEGTAWLKIVVQGIIQVVVAMVILSLGIYYERWKRRRRGRNILKTLQMEMIENYKTIIRRMRTEETEEKDFMISKLMSAVSQLSSGIYKEYLNHLCELPEAQEKSIYKAYRLIESVVGGVGEHLMMPEQGSVKGEFIKRIDDHLVQHCEGILKALSEAIGLFKGGKEALEKLEKERGSDCKFKPFTEVPFSPYPGL